jgi:hypothetical protein
LLASYIPDYGMLMFLLDPMLHNCLRGVRYDSASVAMTDALHAQHAQLHYMHSVKHRPGTRTSAEQLQQEWSLHQPQQSAAVSNEAAIATNETPSLSSDVDIVLINDWTAASRVRVDSCTTS